MSHLNDTPKGERLRIALFGKRNAGKSSLMNALIGEDVALVSDIAGTTTDPVWKNMEFLPLGAVTFVDTAGIDDQGSLGEQRVEKSLAEAQRCDIALYVFAANQGFDQVDEAFCARLQKTDLPLLVIANKSDLPQATSVNKHADVCVSAKTCAGLAELKAALSQLEKKTTKKKTLLQDLFKAGDNLLLVTPIDDAAPKGRLILPQQMIIRDILDGKALAHIMQPESLSLYLEQHVPDLVITDSQVFKEVADILPPNIPLTSFSILMARYKGDFMQLVKGARFLDHLQEHDCILISEGCTHKRHCDDIGTVQLPKLLKKKTNLSLHFDFTSGNDFPTKPKNYALIIHCGGCMLNTREMLIRLQEAANFDIPITNYGLAFAHLNGILERALEPFHL